MTTFNRAAIVAIDVAVWAFVAWLIFAPPDAITRAKAAWYTTRACWTIASWFGQMAMQAELRYHLEMESQA